MKKWFCSSSLIIITVIFGYSQEWLTNFDTAKEIASKNGKPIILVFQGSDWCAPCIKLEKEIWSTDEFSGYAKEHFVMLQADFPRRKKNALPPGQVEHNNKLAEAYNNQGIFPLVVKLNAEGNVLGKTGYKKSTPEAYIALLESLNKS